MAFINKCENHVKFFLPGNSVSQLSVCCHTSHQQQLMRRVNHRQQGSCNNIIMPQEDRNRFA